MLAPLEVPNVPKLEITDCFCGGITHKILLENGRPYKLGHPAYTKSQMCGVIDDYIEEGLLDDEVADGKVIREWFYATHAEDELPKKMPEELRGRTVTCKQHPQHSIRC